MESPLNEGRKKGGRKERRSIREKRKRSDKTERKTAREGELMDPERFAIERMNAERKSIQNSPKDLATSLKIL